MAEPLTNTSKIQVLLAEYAALRGEILGRSAEKFQICTVAGTALVAIIGVSVVREAVCLGIALFLLTVALLAFGLKLLDVITRELATRLRQIEKDVNRLAGDKLLRWENESGIGPRGYFARLKDIFSINRGG